MYIQFQKLQTKLWLFETLLALSIIYRVEIQVLSFHQACNWTDLEKLVVSMIARVIMDEKSVPYDIIRVEMGIEYNRYFIVHDEHMGRNQHIILYVTPS